VFDNNNSLHTGNKKIYFYICLHIAETMRKYPPVTVLNRICTKKIDLRTNIHVPEGTSITIPVFGLHRDPSIYPDPDKFDPERFNSDKVAARHPYAYLPFGEGPRVCIGKNDLVFYQSCYKLHNYVYISHLLLFEPSTSQVMQVKNLQFWTNTRNMFRRVCI